jgi:hypothetical protein
VVDGDDESLKLLGRRRAMVETRRGVVGGTEQDRLDA